MPPTANSYPRADDAPRGTDASEARRFAERSVGAELDNIFRLARADRAPAAPPAPEPRRVTQADLDAALDMLNRAARAMDMLQTRYQEVESYARDVADRAERDLSSAHGQAREWEARATASESLIDELRARLGAAERRAELAERRADAAERGATEARDWLESFYGKIVAAFDGHPFPKAVAA